MKKNLMLAGVISCVMMAFSAQVIEAKESSVKKVWNGSEYGDEETRDHPKCRNGEIWTKVQQPDGSYKWQCRHWLGDEE